MMQLTGGGDTMKRLRELRRKRDLTQDDIARVVGISRSFYTQIENGTRTPSLKVAMRLAHLFDVSVEAIFLPSDVASGITDSNGTGERSNARSA